MAGQHQYINPALKCIHTKPCYIFGMMAESKFTVAVEDATVLMAAVAEAVAAAEAEAVVVAGAAAVATGEVAADAGRGRSGGGRVGHSFGGC